MKPSDFQKTIQCQFECKLKKVVKGIIWNYRKELKRRKNKEISFSELPDITVESLATWDDYQLGVSDEYSLEFTSFDVFGTEVRVYDEKLCEAIKKLSERRRNVVLMFYFLELPDAEIAEILDISRNSVYRNRMCSLKLIRDMYEEEL